MFKKKKLPPQKYIFTDKFEQKFYQYPKIDNIKTNKKRNSVTDAINIINYLRNNHDKIKTGIDLGANIGAVSIAMYNNIAEGGNVFSIEADPDNICRLHENLHLNNLPTHNIINLAISDTIGTTDLLRYDKANGWQTISNKINKYAQKVKYKKVPVNTNTLYNFIKFYNIDTIDLIKIDIEGAEIMALNSIFNMLKNKKIKKIIFEVNQITLQTFDESIDTLLNFWDNLPYKLQVINDDGQLSNIKQYKQFYDCLAEVQP